MLTKEAILEYYPNGQIEWRIPIEWHAFAVYRFHGEAIQYYMSSDGSLGPVKIKRNYQHGVEVGEEVIYYPDGKVMSTLQFRDGRKEGAYIFNHQDGSREECSYEGGNFVEQSIKRFDKHGKHKDEKPEPRRETGSKKILPGDNIPSSLTR